MLRKAILPLLLLLAAALIWTLLDTEQAVAEDVRLVQPPRREEPQEPLAGGSDTGDLEPLAFEAVVAEDEDPHVMPASYRADLATLLGRVVEEDGMPVANIGVTLVGGRLSTFVLPADTFLRKDWVDLDTDGFRLRCAEARTDIEGRFRLALVEPRTLGALVIDPGGPRNLAVLMDQVPVSGEERDLGDIILPGSITFVGKVLDQRAEPIAGARVRATDVPPMVLNLGVADYREGGGIYVAEDGKHVVYIPPPHLARLERYLPIPTTTTGADGSFELAGVPPGIASIVLDDGTHLSTVPPPVPTGPPGSTRDVGALVMRDGYALQGRVLTEDGEPVPGAEVLAGNRMTVAPVTILQGPHVTDEEGAFTFTGLRPETSHVVVRGPKRDAWVISKAVVAGQPEEVIVRLPGLRTLTVRARDSAGAPVEGVRFFGRVLPASGVEAEEFPDLLAPPRPLVCSATPTEPGSYEIVGLDPALWELIARAPEHETIRREVDLSERSEPLELRLKRASVLEVLVQRADDATPLAWARVTGSAEGEFLPVTAGRTDAAGRVVLRGLPEGRVLVRAAYPGLAVASGTADAPSDEPLVIALPTGGTVIGTVLENGRPPASPVWVSLMPRSFDGSDAMVPRVTVTLPDGSFRFDDAEPGPARLEARERRRVSASFQDIMAFFAFNTPLASQDLEVLSGGRTEALLVLGSEFDDIQTGSLGGSLLVNGQPGVGWSIYSWGRINRTTTTDAAGLWDLGLVAAGNVTVRASPPGGFFGMNTVSRETVKVQPGGHALLDLRLFTGSAGGHVLSERDGRRLKGVGLRAVPAEGSKTSFRGLASSSDDNGAFVLEPLPVGRYVVRARAEGYANATSEPFEVRQMGRTSGVVVRMVPPIRVSGTLEVQGLDEAPRWMSLRASSADGRVTQWTRVDAETMEFTFDQLAPGEFTFVFASEAGDEFQPATATLTGPTEGLHLVFVPNPPEPPTDEARDELRKLGYVK